MLFAARAPISVGLVHWPSAEGATVVVKRSYDLAVRGVAPPSRVQEPLGLDRHDASGLLIQPSDFAPTKAMCDVAIIGTALHDPTGPVRIVVGDLRRLVDRAAALAPRPSPGPLGDPGDRSLAGDWTNPGFDFERFQWSAREQRMPIPTLPLGVVVDVGPHRSSVRIDGPAPTVLLVDETGWTAPRPVLLRLDGVGLDVARQRIDLVWRGLAEIAVGSRSLLVVDPSGSIHAASPQEAASWPRAEVVEPSILRRLTARRAPVNTVPLGVLGEDVDSTHAAVALDDFGDDAAASSGSITSKISVPPPVDAALPFVPPSTPSRSPPRSAAPPSPPAPAIPAVVDERRATVAFQVPRDLAAGASTSSAGALPFALATPEEGDDDPLVRTVARVTGPSGSVLPFVDHAGAAPPLRATGVALSEASVLDPLVATAAVVPARAAPLPFVAAPTSPPRAAWDVSAPRVPASSPPVALVPVAPAPVAVAPAAVAVAAAHVAPAPVAPALPAGITPEQYGAIKAELWTSSDGRRATLRKHGLDEVTWRLAERRFVQSVAGERARHEARAVVRRLRDEIAVRVVHRAR